MNRYDIIVADPPWMERGAGKIHRGADRHYPLMPTCAMVNLGDRVQDAAKDDSLLFLWVTANFLPDGLEVMRAWGFEYITQMVWCKTGNWGLGQYVRMNHELVLIGRRGRPLTAYSDPSREKFPSVLHAPKTRHSEKPDALFDIAETFAPDGDWLEMFSRRRRLGWDAWGDEIGVSL